MGVQVIPIPTEVVSHSLPFPFPIPCFSPIPMGFPWDSHSHWESHSHAHLYSSVDCVIMTDRLSCDVNAYHDNGRLWPWDVFLGVNVLVTLAHLIASDRTVWGFWLWDPTVNLSDVWYDHDRDNLGTVPSSCWDNGLQWGGVKLGSFKRPYWLCRH